MGHAHCEHQFKFCAQCDMVWCGSCSKEWGGHAHYQPYVAPNPWWNQRTWWVGTGTLDDGSNTNEVETPGAERHAHGEPVLPDGVTK